MTNLVPVQDPAITARLNGAQSDSGADPKATFMGGTKEQWMDQIPPSLGAVGGLAGAVGGAALTAPAGGVGGAIALGAGGTAAGNYLGNVILNALKNAGVYEGGQQKDIPSMAREAAGAGAVDAAMGMGLPIAGRVIQGGKAALMGIGRPEMAAARQAADLGINLGVSDVSRFGIPQMYEKVIGNFPYMGGPIRKAFDRKTGEVARATSNAVESVGVARGQTEAGRELVDAADTTYRNFRTEVDSAYQAARQAASGASMETANLRRAAQEIVDDWDSQAVQGMTRPEPEVISRAREISQIPDTMNFQQYEGMASEFDRLFRKAKTDGYRLKQTTGIADALEQDLGTLSSPEAKAAWDNARRVYGEGVKKFDSPTAQQFGRVDRNAFRPGFEKPGNLNADEIFTRAFDAKSPMAMRELRDLVGNDAFSNALATHLERKLSGATTEEVVAGKAADILDPALAMRALGLNNPKSPEFAALSAAFNLAGKPDGIRALKQLMDAATAATARGSPNVSQFLARRGVMGGMGALESALPTGAAVAAVGAGHNPLTPLLGFLAANRLSNQLANPKFLREMAIIIDPKTPQEFREAVFKRAFPAQVMSQMGPNPWGQNDR